MRRVATAAGRLAAVLVPLNGVVALGLTLVYLVAGRLADRPVAPRARMPRWWRLGTVMLVVAVALAPTPYLPWSTPASIDPAEDNLVLTQDVARWNPTLTNGASVPAPVLGQTAACVVVPPQRALTHTVVIPAHAAARPRRPRSGRARARGRRRRNGPSLIPWSSRRMRRTGRAACTCGRPRAKVTGSWFGWVLPVRVGGRYKRRSVRTGNDWWRRP